MRTTKNNKNYKQEEPEEKGMVTGSELMTLEEKRAILDQLGQPDLIDLFKNVKATQTRKKKTVPLDQRVSFNITAKEKTAIVADVEDINKRGGEQTSISSIMRSRAIGNIDINGWAEIAKEALKDLQDTEDNLKAYNKRKRHIEIELDEIDDDEEEDVMLLSEELLKIDSKLDRMKSISNKRNIRVTGRMTMAESEVVKWRAQRLFLSTSDFLRIVIFDLDIMGEADKHLSLEAKRRFYVGIIDVAQNGWGDPPTIYKCNQCVAYLEEIDRLRKRVQQLELSL